MSSHASACSHSIDYFLPNGQRVTNGNVFQKANPDKKQGSEEESPKFRLDYQRLASRCEDDSQKRVLMNAGSSNSESKKITDSSASYEEPS